MTIQDAVQALAEVMPGEPGKEAGVVSALERLARVTADQVSKGSGKLIGKALVGELCVEPVVRGHNIITAIRGCLVVIFNARLLNEDEEIVRAMYPRYAKVAVKEPSRFDVGDYLPYPVVIALCPLEVEFVGVNRRGPGIGSLRDEGNRYFREGQFMLAILCYNECMIEDPGSEAERMLAASNKALACTKLGMYEEAVKACEWVLARDGRNTKCLFRKGVALWAMQQFQQAIPLFEAALEDEANGSRKTIEDHLKRCAESFNQSYHGVFDLEHFYCSGLEASKAPTCSDYVSPAVAVGRQGGLIVTRPVRVGELLLVASSLVPQCSDFGDWYVKALRMCWTSRRLQTQLLSLHPDNTLNLTVFQPNAGVIEESSAAVDVPKIVQVLSSRCLTFAVET